MDLSYSKAKAGSPLKPPKTPKQSHKRSLGVIFGKMKFYGLGVSKIIPKVRQPGIEPGSIAWKATMLTFTPPTLLSKAAIARVVSL